MTVQTPAVARTLDAEREVERAASTRRSPSCGQASVCAHCALPCGDERYCCLGCELAHQIASEAQAGEQHTSSVLTVAAFLSVTVMMLSLFLYAEDAYDATPSDGLLWLRQGYRIAAGVLATPVVVMLGRRLFARAFAALRHRRLSIELLIGVGALAAYALSWKAVLFNGGEVYFDTACAALLLSTLGRFLEARVRRRAAGVIAPLLGNSGLTKVRAGWTAEALVLCAPVDVEPGMLVEVAPETATPVDLRATAAAEVDLQAIRGEPWPCRVTAGDVVVAGAVVHGAALRGTALCRAQDSTLRQLEALARDTRAQRAGVTKLADRLASVLIPVVFAVALTTFGYWLWHEGAASAVQYSLAVLLVACPCTYGVLVPLLQWRTLRLALATKQVCIRDVSALDRLAAIDSVVFDKTGTLTEPMQQVTLACAAGTEATAVWRSVAALEQDVRHPLGRALAMVAARALAVDPSASEIDDGATAADPNVDDDGGAFVLRERRQLPGLGVVATTPAGSRLALGSLRLMKEQRASGQEQLASADAAATGSPIYLALDQHIIARLTVDERLRQDALVTVRALDERGIAQVIASGDDAERVAHIGRQLGIPALGALRAGDKQRALPRGRHTAFVGDGINDVPAMAAADVSIAFGSGASALACGVADVVVLTPDLTTLPWLLDQAKGALRTARTALAVSTAYNVLFIGMAAFGLLTPIWAGLSMLLSSLITLAAVVRRSGAPAAKPMRTQPSATALEAA